MAGVIERFRVKTRAYYDLVKPELPVAAGICVIVGQVIASRGLPPAGVLAFGFITGFPRAGRRSLKRWR
jgi:geranylgeranylglycerol-phosphate geranylgeranyltransferase